MEKIREKVTSLPVAAGAIALAAALLAVGWAQTVRLNAATARLNAVTQKAFYETCELTEAMSVELRKLPVAGDSGQMQTLLGDISRQAEGAAGNLALLPMGEDAVAATLKFINQTGDFAETLSVRLANGGAISEEEYATIGTMSETAASLTVGLSSLADRLENGEATLDGSGESDLSSLFPLTNPASEYPTLLYDGPFSDGNADGAWKTLESAAEISQEDAAKMLSTYFNGAESITFVDESDIPVDCYEFSLVSAGHRLSAGVTKRGGEVLYALCEDEPAEGAMTDAELIDIARAFLLSRGYGDMEMSYYSGFGGVLTVNFAAVQDNVVLYPDLIKVQVARADGAVVGIEAAKYLANHAKRTLELPRISEEDAMALLGDRLTGQSVRLCVIPTDSDELLAYEIRAVSGSDVFLVYIDAMTGAERELMQVVSDTSGVLVM